MRYDATAAPGNADDKWNLVCDDITRPATLTYHSTTRLADATWFIGELCDLNTDDTGIGNVERCDLDTNTWTTMTMTSEAQAVRHRHAAVACRGRIYVTGGLSKTLAGTSVAVYDPIVNSWTPLPDMTIPRHDDSAL